MRHPLFFAIAALCLSSIIGSSNACEKHVNGHQNSSDTNVEGSKK